VWKITILRKKILFFPILGGGAHLVRPPLDPPLSPMYMSSTSPVILRSRVA
jgi:hypothetical protein